VSRIVASREVDGEQVANDPQVLVALAGRVVGEVLVSASSGFGVTLTPRQVTYRLTAEAEVPE
jgi:hypothetical protein